MIQDCVIDFTKANPFENIPKEFVAFEKDIVKAVETWANECGRRKFPPFLWPSDSSPKLIISGKDK